LSTNKQRVQYSISVEVSVRSKAKKNPLMVPCSADIKTIKSPFLFLALDLPAAPLFQDLNEKKIIPQVPLSTILAKFDGESTQEIGPTLKRHHLTRLPPYLILHIKRFTKNNFVEEKNPTIVNYPMAIDLKDCESAHLISSPIV
jgi:U4/U6.U5 tri-snRNP-associated protein 2